MSVPLSDTRLDLHRRLSALSRKPYGDMEAALADLLAEVDRLRALVADYQGEVVRYDADHERLSTELGRLRELLAPAQLAEWAGQLQSAGLTPHPAFACRSTTAGYEAAMQVATTDQLTDAARERLLAELQVAFDETVRRVLGYRPAAAPPEPSCGVLNPKVAATCTEPNDHPSPIHRDAFGNTWTRRDGERALSIPSA